MKENTTGDGIKMQEPPIKRGAVVKCTFKKLSEKFSGYAVLFYNNPVPKENSTEIIKFVCTEVGPDYLDFAEAK